MCPPRDEDPFEPKIKSKRQRPMKLNAGVRDRSVRFLESNLDILRRWNILGDRNAQKERLVNWMASNGGSVEISGTESDMTLLQRRRLMAKEHQDEDIDEFIMCMYTMKLCIGSWSM